MSVYSSILEKVRAGEKQFVVLIDPDKADRDHLQALFEGVDHRKIDLVFLGGSAIRGSVNKTLSMIREYTELKVVLFPGDASQVDPAADAILFLSLLSGRNPDYLIGNHIKAIPLLEGLEVIPVSYLLIDGGHVSTTEKVTKTQPMSLNDVDSIVNTAKAGELLGHKMVYLEAGSGASRSIPLEVVVKVKEVLAVPLIVGGGLRSKEDVGAIYNAGADIVVVGNFLENNPRAIESIIV